MNKEKIINFLKEHVWIFLMNVIMFIILYILIPLLFNRVNAYVWRPLFVLAIVAITDIFYLLKKIKYEHVLYSLPILYVLTLFIIDYCTRRDLYGITSHGNLDKCPALVDALLINLVIVFFQYLTLFITRSIKKIINKKKGNEEVVEEEKKEESKKKKTTTKKTTTK